MGEGERTVMGEKIISGNKGNEGNQRGMKGEFEKPK